MQMMGVTLTSTAAVFRPDQTSLSIIKLTISQIDCVQNYYHILLHPEGMLTMLFFSALNVIGTSEYRDAYFKRKVNKYSNNIPCLYVRIHRQAQASSPAATEQPQASITHRTTCYLVGSTHLLMQCRTLGQNPL
jgi:hypothetical protein